MLPHPTDRWSVNADLDWALGYGTKMGSRNHSVSILESQQHIINPTHPSGALDDGVEHRLHVRRRAADDAKHFGRRRLMLQRLPQLRVARFEFLKQSDVFNSNH